MKNNTKNMKIKTSCAIANRATTKETRAIRAKVQRGLTGAAFDFSTSIDFDLVASWINGEEAN